jgi:hypothetical protein
VVIESDSLDDKQSNRSDFGKNDRTCFCFDSFQYEDVGKYF